MSLLHSPGITESRFVDIDGLNLHYLTAGPEDGEPVILVHGWPTSSFLWRNVMPSIAEHRRVVALDLPAFGRSSKPTDVSYSLRFYERVLGGFAEHLGADRVGLVVHDLGGPIGLYWAAHNSERIERLALLNTLVYTEMSWAVIAFVTACRLPGVRSYLTSPSGLRGAMRLGVHNRDRLDKGVIAAYQEPFKGKAARRALAKAGFGVHPNGLKEIVAWLPTVDVPVCLTYGARDRILPDVAETMARVKKDVPHAELHELPDCGHFLQEDRPDEIGKILGDFFA